MNAPTQKLTRDHPAPYPIKVPGELGEHWLESEGRIVLPIERTGEELPLLPLYLVLVVLMPWHGPVGEEYGWRGYALPNLPKKYGPLWVSLLGIAANGKLGIPSIGGGN